MSASAPAAGPFAFECRGLSHVYHGRNATVPAVADVDLAVQPGAFVCVVGPSGCGKTTLLKLVAGLLDPSSGSVTRAAAPPGRRPASLVFQEDALFPWLTVQENVAFALECLGLPRVECLERARAGVRRVGLEAFLHGYPHELSAGMRQRVGLVRALAMEAPLLLMDEPFSALDAQTRLLLQHELLELWREERKTVVFVTHDIEEAVLLGDEVLVLSGRPGRILDRISVPLARPRDLLDREQPELQALRRRIWSRIEPEARRSLGMAP